jgi:hypothetical protein
MAVKSSVFDETYNQYLARIAQIDFKPKEEILGIQVEGNEIVIPFFGRPYRVSTTKIVNPSGKQPPLNTSVVLCKYLLLCPQIPALDKEWVSYRDFKDTAPLIGKFINHIERPIAQNFTGRFDELDAVLRELGGKNLDLDLSYQLIMKLFPLPKVPVLLLFDDADDEFPAQCKVLFESRADQYLDPECLTIVGMHLADYLKADVT